MVKIPENYAEIFRKKSFVHLATVNANGSPQVSPVWVDYDGEHVLVNSARGRVKDRNMRRNPKVALSVLDPDNPYRNVVVQGEVVAITEEGADAHIDYLANKYLGVASYPNRRADETRVIYRIAPRKIAVMG